MGISGWSLTLKPTMLKRESKTFVAPCAIPLLSSLWLSFGTTLLILCCSTSLSVRVFCSLCRGKSLSSFETLVYLFAYKIRDSNLFPAWICWYPLSVYLIILSTSLSVVVSCSSISGSTFFTTRGTSRLRALDAESGSSLSGFISSAPDADCSRSLSGISSAPAASDYLLLRVSPWIFHNRTFTGGKILFFLKILLLGKMS